MRIAGVNVPDTKRIDVALTYIYGIGAANVKNVLEKAAIDGAKRTKSLSEEEVGKIQKVLDEYRIEGELKADIARSIKRLKEIGSYRGLRHVRNLPVRGQRTRSNARTKRGKRVTIGAIRKEMAERMGIIQKAAGTKEEKK